MRSSGSVAETGTTDVWTVFVFVEPFEKVRDVSSVVAFSAFEKVLVFGQLFAADLADPQSLGGESPVRYLLFVGMDDIEETGDSAGTLLDFEVFETFLFPMQFVSFQSFQFFMFRRKLECLLELRIVLPEEGELMRKIGNRLQISVLIEIGLDYLFYLLLLVLRGRVGSVEEDVVETRKAAETFLQFVAEVLSLLLIEKFSGEVQPIRQLQVQVQKQMIVVLLFRQIQVHRLLVVFVAQKQEAELEIAVFRSDFVVARESYQEIEVDLQAVYPLWQGTDLPEFSLGILLENIHKRSQSTHDLLRLLKFDLMRGSPYEMLSEKFILISQQTRNGPEAHDNILK